MDPREHHLLSEEAAGRGIDAAVKELERQIMEKRRELDELQRRYRRYTGKNCFWG